jgi:hypothetical protein
LAKARYFENRLKAERALRGAKRQSNFSKVEEGDLGGKICFAFPLPTLPKVVIEIFFVMIYTY